MEMFYSTAYCTDKGIKKDTNQDSAILMQADTAQGPVIFAALCDGMGGLEKGELASAAVVRRFERWFTYELAQILNEPDFSQKLKDEWEKIIQNANQAIVRYAKQANTSMGTTLVALLIRGEDYFIVNIGDSRVYSIDREILQLTHDHTFVQKEMDAGRMSVEQAEQDARRSVLLQCIGASQTIRADYFAGKVERRQRFLLSCDGFRHVISPSEIWGALAYENSSSQSQMQQALERLVELNKQRGEPDNITAIVIEC